MHEYGVALEIARMAMENAGSRKIMKINLRIGDLSGVAGESIAMYCDLIFREKQPEKAVEVAIERVAATFLCTCGERYESERIFNPCPACGSFERSVVDGNQCTIESIEVEDE